MSKTSANIIRTEFAYGEIVDSKLCIIKVPFGIGERNDITELQSNTFKGCSVGDKFWFSYKQQPVGKPLIVNSTKIIDGASYNVIVSDVNEELARVGGIKAWNEEVQQLDSMITNMIGETRNCSNVLLAAADPNDASRLEIATNLLFLEAYDLSKEINNRVGDKILRTRFAVARKIVANDEAKEEVKEEAIPELQRAPEWVQDTKTGLRYWLSESMRTISGAAKSIMNAGGHLNILLKGNSGFGKTSMAEALAAYLGYDFLRVNCAQMLDTVAWFGSNQAKEGTTSFVPSDFTKALRQGKYVIVLDEINRVESWLHNTLFPLLDHARKTSVAEMEIVAAPSIVFVLTMNEGSSFSGTYLLDAAFANRVDITDVVTEPSLVNEIKIVESRVGSFSKTKMVVEAVRKLRAFANDPKVGIPVDASTRTSIKVARLCSLGMKLHDALMFVIANNIPESESKPIIDIINQF